MTLQIGPPAIPAINRNKIRGECAFNGTYFASPAATGPTGEGPMPKLVCTYCEDAMLFTGQVEETEDGGMMERFRCRTCKAYTFVQVLSSSTGMSR